MSSEQTHHKDMLRRLPSVDKLLQECGDSVDQYGHQAVASALRAVLDDSRKRIASGESAKIDVASVKEAARQVLHDRSVPSLRRVFNLTGTVLHTNLGRAVLPIEARDAIAAAATEYNNLEFDLETGKRGSRECHVEELLRELTGAEAATVVNNNAAAVLLVLNTLAMNKEVPVSRGELVEIGGSFRIPEVMQRANCTLVEVGATNRTHLRDYRAAISDQTGLLMKVHTSNYRIEGFTSEVAETELAGLASEHNLPFVMDLGSGSLLDLGKFGLPAEPTAGEVIAMGAGVVTFSGDKLLGGPQCGLIAGEAELIDRINANPLKRALRADKLTLAGITAVLNLYRNPDAIRTRLPTLRHLTRTQDEMRTQAQRLAPLLADSLGAGFHVEIVDSEAQVGSGSLPSESIASTAIAISAAQERKDIVRSLASAFRNLPTPVIGHAHKGRLLLDLRCLDDEQGFIAQLEHLQV